MTNNPVPSTVLVVEDDAGIAELERGRLEDAGYRVLTAADADQALAAVGGAPVDLVLLDYRLPGVMDGLMFYERLKAAGHDLPVILVTGYGDEATVIRSMRAGVRDFVPKSIEYLDYLPQAVGRVLTQVRTERQLAESESRYRSLVETTNEWVWVCDVGGRMRYNNPALETILGYRPEDVQGENTLDLILDDDRPAAAALLADSTDGRKGWTGRVLRWRHRDGSVRHLESNAVALLGPRGEVTGFQGSDRDITQRLQLEEQFRQAQKMEAVGRLAGGVAHDFNNLLTVIIGNAELVLETGAAGDADREPVGQIHQAGVRAAALTRQLLAFSRKEILQPQVIDLNRQLREVEQLLQRMIGKDVALAVETDPRPAVVRIDPTQAEQVVMNLAVNARDAMPTGGTLTIRTQVPDGPDGGRVRLSVTDTGVGMDDDTRGHIFEPFFTTKEPGRGTGLGLAMVYGIVRHSGGTIEVASAPGNGTTFTIDLPMVEDEAALPEGTLAAPGPPAPHGSETLLVVEDEDSVRLLIREALAAFGYQVLEAVEGSEAERVAAAHPGPIHLLVTDVVMPGASGPVVAERLAAQRPGLKVLYTSGYTDDAVLRQGVVEATDAFLQKPFTPLILCRKVREVLDRG